MLVLSRYECDVLVVGGGMAGVSIAAAVAADRNVLLVEADPQLARHATGRSAAVWLPSYGGPAVRALTVASRAMYDELSGECGVPLLTARGQLWVAVDEPSLAAVHRLVGQTDTVELLTANAARALCPALRPEVLLGAGYDSAAMDIEVAALHQLYVTQLRRHQGILLAGSPLHALRHEAGRWTAAVGADQIGADVVLDAAGAWVDRVAALAEVRPIGLQPRRRSAFTCPLPDGLHQAARWPLVGDAAERWYVKPEGGQILGSPAEETPSEPCDARPDELEIARALEEINAATTLELRHVSRSWAGLRSFVDDREPVVGSYPEQPGFFFFAGQGGYGIQLAPALAALGAALLTGRSLPAHLASAGIEPATLSPQRLP